MRTLLATLAITLTITGCASRSDFSALLDTWVGAKEHELVAANGVPQRIYETGGHKYLTYEGSDTSSTFATYVNGPTVTYGYGPGSFTRSCRVTFEVTGDVVTAWSSEGNSCY